MKTRKKLLHSTLILALALGQTSGTVVEAVSMLSSVESSSVKQSSKKNEKTSTSKKEPTENNTNSKKQSQSKKIRNLDLPPTFTIANDETSDRVSPAKSKQYGTEVASYINYFVNKMLNKNIDVSEDNYEVGDTIIFPFYDLFIRTADQEFFNDTWWNQQPWSGSTQIATLSSIAQLNSGSVGIPGIYSTATTISKSGNWSLRISAPDAAAYSLYDHKVYAILTRLKLAVPQEEIFDVDKFVFTYSKKMALMNIFIVRRLIKSLYQVQKMLSVKLK